MGAPIVTFNVNDWFLDSDSNLGAVEALEQGNVLHFPYLSFPLLPVEEALLDPSLVAPKRKNISLDVQKEKLSGVEDPDKEQLVNNLLSRFYQASSSLVQSLFPQYQDFLRQPTNSLRVHSVSQWQKEVSWRKDDKRLHVDAFPSRPLSGDRILRVFTNINPHGETRKWRVGEPFSEVVNRFLPLIKPYSPVVAWTKDKLGITKTKQTPYDHFMLELHDAMKTDLNYQKNAKQHVVSFQPGSTWICFSDQVPHAATKGQFLLEQTFIVERQAMIEPALSPLKQLEAQVGHKLI